MSPPLSLVVTLCLLVLCSGNWLCELFSHSFIAQPCGISVYAYAETSCRVLEVFFCIASSSVEFCCATSSLLSLPKLCSLSPLSRTALCLGSLPPFLSFGLYLQAESGDNNRTQFICFSSLQDHSLGLPVFITLKTVVSCSLSSFLTVYSGRVNLATVSLSWSKSKDSVHTYIPLYRESPQLRILRRYDVAKDTV